jgi:hypothetical protein
MVLPRIRIRPILAALVLSATATAVVTCTGASAGFAQQADRREADQDFAAATDPGVNIRVLPVLRHVGSPPRATRRPAHHPIRPRPHFSFASNRDLGRHLAAERGWDGEQWSCLDDLWTRESDWHVHERNTSSGAYGIPQSLPADKMADAGSDWRDSAITQIRWGLSYIAATYGTPCSAWEHSQEHGYY